MCGNFAPQLAECTDDLLFDDVWNRLELFALDESLVIVAVRTVQSNFEHLGFRLGRAGENVVNKKGLLEALTQLMLYSGWPSRTAARGGAN